ncbi:MAG: TVP38/TMEM64 family protein [Roseovarius sp.]
MDQARPNPTARLIRHLPLTVILCAAAIGALTLSDFITFDTLRDHREALLAYRDAHFALVATGFVVAYVVIVAFSLPGGAVASVTGGFLFGAVLGTALNVAAATGGATVIFLAARAGLGDVLARRIEASDGRLKRIKRGLHEHEVNVLLIMRLVPAVPFFVANLLPALVGVRFVNFLWTTALGIIPGTCVFASIGAGLGEVFARGETPDLSLLWDPWILGPLLGLCALAALPIALKALGGQRDI